MKILDTLRIRIAAIFQRSEVRADMDEELRSHIEHRADELEHGGMARAEAERRARIEFGGPERYKEESYEALGGHFMQTLFQDVQFAFRILRKSKGFTIAAVVTLALAIGANAVVFGVLDALVLHTLNVPDAKSLYGTEYGADIGFQSYPSYLDLRERNQSFQDLAAFNFTLGTAIDPGNDPKAAGGFSTTGNYFTVLDVHPYLGRLYTAADEHGPGSAPYLVLSYGYWHSRFQDDRGIIGRVVRVNKHPFTVIGVTPPEFRGTIMFVSPDFFLPVVEQELIGGNSLTDRTNTAALFETFGHLKPGVTREQAEADVNRVAGELAKAYPKDFEAKRMVVGRTKQKAVLVPACLRGAKAAACRARLDGVDMTCTACDPACAVNRITQRMRILGAKVYLVAHTKGFSRWLDRWQREPGVGVTAVACLLNILPGGYEMRSRGIASQCVPLDYPGCRKHWSSKGIATSVNEDRLVKIVAASASAAPMLRSST